MRCEQTGGNRAWKDWKGMELGVGNGLEVRGCCELTERGQESETEICVFVQQNVTLQPENIMQNTFLGRH